MHIILIILLVLFTILLLMMLGFLLWGLISLKSFQRFIKRDDMARRQVGFTFGILSLALIVLNMVIASALPSPPKTTHTHETASKTSATKATASQSKTTQNSQKPKNTTQPAATPKPVSNMPTLTAYGALLKDWNAHHNEDSRYDTNAAYNPNPSLGENGSTSDDDAYYAVQWSDGQNADSRALNYSMRFPSGQTVSVTRAVELNEFPSDAKIRWAQSANSDPTNACYQMDVSSQTLANVLGSGDVLVELFTEPTPTPDYSSYYNASNVNNALIQNVGYKTAADAPGC